MMKNILSNYKRMMNLLVILTVSLLFIYCKDINKKNSESNKTALVMIEKTKLPFDLDNPNKVIKLTNQLQEISSLTFYKDSQLICIEDERADIYIVDCQTEQITEHITSNETGDYEGVELVGGNLFLLKSNGTITELQNFKQSNQKQLVYKTDLSSKNDTEGLGFDPKTNSLLVACKNKPFLINPNETSENDKCIYQFDLKTKTLKSKPFITINLEKLQNEFGINQFMPSGIAVHPLTGEFYILSAVGKLLMVLNRSHEIVYLKQLNPKMFKQAEGICFSPDGKTLFISNEGKEKKANILIFNSL